MAAVTYVARRALAPSHSAGDTFSIAISIIDLAYPDGGDLKEQQQSISGDVEIQWLGEVRIWSVTLAPVRYSEAAILFEFLRSTSDGQTFTFDPFGTVGSPVLSMSVVRADEGYTTQPFVREGKGGYTDLVSLGFKVREV